MAAALKSLGYKLGDQPTAELLLEDWAHRRFQAIVKYCKRAEAFQDVPFSLDFTYQAVDQAFPESKFILTVRNSADDWYDSLVRFHTKILKQGHLPKASDLKAFPYRERGWIWRAQKLIYGIDEATLYDRDIYINHYKSHNERVKRYFRYRPDDLLVLNVSKPDAMDRLSTFLGVPAPAAKMPHLNRSN